MKKIMVIDTQGEQITDAYRALLPDISIRGYELKKTRGTPCHEHGALCGWLAAVPCQAARIEAQLIFVRVFDKKAAWVPGAEDLILQVISDEQPDYVSRSWGAWDQDSQMGSLMAKASFGEFTQRYLELMETIGFADFGAAGNDDFNDRDNDIDYPQRVISGCNIIGACDRVGRPTIWSGDGPELQCLMWGDRVWSPDIHGKWHVWSGTSASTPKACGGCAALQFNDRAWKQYVMAFADSPAGIARPHPKFGYGCMEHVWQEPIQKLRSDLAWPHVGQQIKIEFHDYKRFK